MIRHWHCLFAFTCVGISSCTMSGDPDNSGIFYSPQLATRDRVVKEYALHQSRQRNLALRSQYTKTRNRELATQRQLGLYQRELAAARKELLELQSIRDRLAGADRQLDDKITGLRNRLRKLDENPPNIKRLSEIRQKLQNEISRLKRNRLPEF